MEEISVDTLPGAKSWEIKWEFCATQGKECTCPGTVRYGHAGMMQHYENDGQFFHDHPETVRWLMRPGLSKPINCDVANFGARDPFPDIPAEKKICQCAAAATMSDMKITGVVWGRIPGSIGAYFEAQHTAAHLFKTCASNGGFCACNGAVRFGEPAHAIHANQFAEFWEQIIEHPNVVNGVEGKWYTRGGVVNGVDCKRENFERPYNHKRIQQNDHDETICQCLQGDTNYPLQYITEYQLLSLADLPVGGQKTAALAKAYLKADENMVKSPVGVMEPPLATLGKYTHPSSSSSNVASAAKATSGSSSRRGGVGGGEGERGGVVSATVAVGAVALIAALAGVVSWVVGKHSSGDDESIAVREPLLPPA